MVATAKPFGRRLASGIHCLAWLTICCAARQPAPLSADEGSTSRPNILLILADDLGYSDLGCYGGEIETPVLDQLAAGGLRFSQFYSTARCWPTRAALLTGYYAQQVRRDAVPGIRSGTQGTRPEWAPLLPQLLRQFGYRSYHSGKWHLDGRPLQNGFDRSYSLNDHDRHFAPKQHQRDDVPLPPVQASEGYYSTIAIAQHTIDFLSEHAAEHADQPFFSFVAFTAPHFPVQAPQVDIQRYQERYRAGWDALREQRWQRLQSSGLVVGGLSSIERDLGPPYAFPEAIKKLGPDEVDRPLAWATLGQSQQAFQAQKMAVHAAMVDRMDREIGRILEQVRKMNAWDHTLVLFLSDNGASAEIMVRGDGHDRQAACGTGATFLSIGPGWSSLANTPFRRHKTWVHEGGIASPLIVHWPQGIRSPGSICALPSHAIDVVQTLLELAGETDVQAAGSTVKRPGISLVPSFRGVTQKREQALWWLHEGNRALRVGNWKIVASANQSWELYDLGVDRAEEHDLAAEDPQRLTALTTEWERIWKEVAEDARSGVASEPAVPSKPVKEAGDAHTPEHR